MKSEDQRVQRTQKLILSAFEGMVRRMDYRKINISGISDAAGVARQTVRAHYESVDDILLACIQEHERSISASRNIDLRNLLFPQWMFAEIESWFKGILELEDLYRILFQNNLEVRALTSMKESFSFAYGMLLGVYHLDIPLEELLYYIDFQAYGAIGLIKRCIMGEKLLSLEESCAITQRIQTKFMSEIVLAGRLIPRMPGDAELINEAEKYLAQKQVM